MYIINCASQIVSTIIFACIFQFTSIYVGAKAIGIRKAIVITIINLGLLIIIVGAFLEAETHIAPLMYFKRGMQIMLPGNKSDYIYLSGNSVLVTVLEFCIMLYMYKSYLKVKWGKALIASGIVTLGFLLILSLNCLYYISLEEQ